MQRGDAAFSFFTFSLKKKKGKFRHRREKDLKSLVLPRAKMLLTSCLSAV